MCFLYCLLFEIFATNVAELLFIIPFGISKTLWHKMFEKSTVGAIHTVCVKSLYCVFLETVITFEMICAEA